MSEYEELRVQFFAGSLSPVLLMSSEFNAQTFPGYKNYQHFTAGFICLCVWRGRGQASSPYSVVFVPFPCISVSSAIHSEVSTVPPEESMLKLCRECMTAIRLIPSLFLSSPAFWLDTSAPLGELNFSYSAVRCKLKRHTEFQGLVYTSVRTLSTTIYHGFTLNESP